jgi:N-acetylmuramate 1-kinase
MLREQIIRDFLNKSGMESAEPELLAGDASFRKYYRIKNNNKFLVLMDAPPPYEKISPFILVGNYLKKIGLSSPDIIKYDEEGGLILLEDLGDDLFSRVLNDDSKNEEKLYITATDALIHLHNSEKMPDIPDYDNKLLMQEFSLFSEWYMPLFCSDAKLDELKAEYKSICTELLPLCHLSNYVCVLRDYHADNLIWLPEREGITKVGMLDFQDAVLGPASYDLVSLLQDARRDVSEELEFQVIEYFIEQQNLNKDEFLTNYCILGAQRNLKIIGIFTRLCKRDNKPNYLKFIPRVWKYLENDLRAVPELSRLKEFLDKNFSSEIRTQPVRIP